MYKMTTLSIWRNPLLTPFDNSPCTRVPLTYLESLLSVWCDPRPPWSQVAGKLTSPSPFPFPAPNGSPNSIVRPPKTTSRHQLHLVRKNTFISWCDYHRCRKTYRCGIFQGVFRYILEKYFLQLFYIHEIQPMRNRNLDLKT